MAARSFVVLTLLALLVVLWRAGGSLDGASAGDGQTFVVNVAENAVDLPDGTCDDTCTLKDAITAANNVSGEPRTITFDPVVFAPGEETTIIPLNPLPKIRAESPITIDGSGADVTIAGFEMATAGNGLEFTTQAGFAAADIVVRNLALYQIPGNSIYVCPAPGPDLVIACSYDVSNVLIEDVRVEQGQSIGIFVRGVSVDDVTVRNSTHVDSVSETAVAVWGRALTDITVDGLDSQGGGGVLYNGLGMSTDTDMSDVRVVNSHVQGSSIVVLPHGVEMLLISGNEVSDVGGVEDAIDIFATEIRNSQVSDNIVTNSGRYGIRVFGPTTSDLSVTSNTVTNSAQTGIHLDNQFGGDNNVVDQNVTTGNGGAGITVLRGGPFKISRNAAHNNGGIGIDLGGNGVTPNDAGDTDTGPNGLLNFPEFSTPVGYAHASGTACGGCLIEIFESDDDPSGYGEGKEFLFDLTADSSGDFIVPLCGLELNAGDKITATATDGEGNTSEFSENYTLLQDSEPCPTPTPSPTPSPTPTATASPTLTATPTLSDTPTPTSSTPAGELVWGDGDCGGAVNLGDAIGIARHLVSLPVNQEGGCPGLGSDITFDGTSRIWQDIDCSGGVSLGDAIGIARFLVSLTVNKPEDCPDIGTVASG